MITPQDVADRTWELPSTEIIDLQEKTIEIIIKYEVFSELEAIDLSTKYLPLIKRILEEKINESIKNDVSPKFIFSETSPYRLIGSVNIGNIHLLMQLLDEIVNLIIQVNNIQESNNKQKIFELTSRDFGSQPILRKPIKNERDLGEFIDALYFIIYEGSRDLSRIPRNIQEIIVVDDPEKLRDDFIGMEIKHLRSFIRHDPYQLEEPEIRIRLVSNICNKYVGKSSIATFLTSDFLKFQENFLKELKRFLTSLKSMVSASETL